MEFLTIILAFLAFLQWRIDRMATQAKSTWVTFKIFSDKINFILSSFVYYDEKDKEKALKKNENVINVVLRERFNSSLIDYENFRKTQWEYTAECGDHSQKIFDSIDEIMFEIRIDLEIARLSDNKTPKFHTNPEKLREKLTEISKSTDKIFLPYIQKPYKSYFCLFLKNLKLCCDV